MRSYLKNENIRGIKRCVSVDYELSSLCSKLDVNCKHMGNIFMDTGEKNI